MQLFTLQKSDYKPQIAHSQYDIITILTFYDCFRT